MWQEKSHLKQAEPVCYKGWSKIEFPLLGKGSFRWITQFSSKSY